MEEHWFFHFLRSKDNKINDVGDNWDCPLSLVGWSHFGLNQSGARIGALWRVALSEGASCSELANWQSIDNCATELFISKLSAIIGLLSCGAMIAAILLSTQVCGS